MSVPSGRENAMLYIKNTRKIHSLKHGFSLIETVIGMALLLIVIVIVYQGFTSTIQLSANTAKFEANGDLQAGLVSHNVAVAPTIAPLVTPAAYLHLERIGLFKKNIGIQVYSTPPLNVTDTNFGLEAYREVSTGPNSGSASTNRTGFWYMGRSLTP